MSDGSIVGRSVWAISRQVLGEMDGSARCACGGGLAPRGGGLAPRAVSRWSDQLKWTPQR
jgi:hypothetical protein